MAQKNRKADEGSQAGITAEHYYDYEARFVKQKREQERINILPRVIKPAMFAKGEFALGDLRVFSRYTVAPLSMLTCGFLDLRAGAQTEIRRMLPSLIAYIIEGSGEAVQLFHRYVPLFSMSRCNEGGDLRRHREGLLKNRECSERAHLLDSLRE